MKNGNSQRALWSIGIGLVLSVFVITQVRSSPQAAMADSHPTALSSISAQLGEGYDKPEGVQLVQSGIDILDNSKSLRLEDELNFTINVVNFCSVSPGHEDELKNIIDLLKTRHADEPYALAKILRVEAIAANSLHHDPKVEGELLSKAIDNVNQSRVETALLHLELTNRLAESYLSQGAGGDANGSRAKALENFRKVMDFPFMDQPYFSRVDEFKKLYTQAALRVVELTPVEQLHEVHFYPFVLEELESTFSGKANAISTVPVDITKFDKSMETWLRLKLRDEPNDGAMRPHLQAILDYVEKASK